ncbi:MAG: VOC family protein [Proteobacteria bacterium]|nr:MAG: VOC family protein [Pseudomonadota bacterium]
MQHKPSQDASRIKGLHHAGLSVSDLDRSIAFYCDLLGMRLLRQDAFQPGSLDRITALPGARGRSAMLQAGAQYLELFEFATPTPRPRDVSAPVCDHGISHVCVEVTDLEGAYRRLSEAGVRFHCPPQAFAHMKATYARDPDGNVVELLEIPASA